ncbi:MAG: hypothetical protein IJT50_03835 [Lentisphaeria bacterium]|nr:hypothetical protein [Lentisphaeria bacterium]
MKKTIAALSAVCLFCGIRAEEYQLNRASDWTNPQIVQHAPGILRATGRVVAFSKKIYPYDPGKKYVIKGLFRQLPGSDSNIFRIGIQPLGEDKKPMEWAYTHVAKGTDTTLVSPVKPEDKSILVADASKWRKSAQLAFHTNPDLSDLPNRNIARQFPQSIKKTAEGWRVTYSKALGISAPAGTGVRQHHRGGPFRYAGSGTAGEVLGDLPCRLWDAGTKYFRVVILSGTNRLNPGDRTPIFEMQNPRLEVK